MNREFDQYVREYSMPSVLDIETAKRLFFEENQSATDPNTGLIGSNGVISRIERRLYQSPGPVLANFDRLEPDLNLLKARIAAHEALSILESQAIIIGFGTKPTGQEDLNVTAYSHYNTQSFGPVYIPPVYSLYRLTASFRTGQNFRLSSGDIYLSSINHTILPSRAVRCLKECGDAFRYGLYLSATMTIGAASESLWMELASTMCDKNMAGTKNLVDEIQKSMPNIGQIIDPAWKALMTYQAMLLGDVIGPKGERDKFRLYAERLREHRNYAMHNEDAGTEEPWFTFDETGLLLLEATTYFNQFADLLVAVRALL